MILLGDTSLTSGQYTNLLAATADPTLEVTLEQYSLAFASHDSGGSASEVDCFDAIVCGDRIIRAWRSALNTILVQCLDTEDAGDESWTASATLTCTGVSSSIPPSFATDGISVRLFWTNGATLYYREAVGADAHDAGNWGASVTVATVTSIGFMAATSMTQALYLIQSANYNWIIYRAYLSGTWQTDNMGLYWQFVPNSFDAIAAWQEDDSGASAVDAAVFGTDYPPLIGQKVEVTTLVHTVTRVQGLACIRVQNFHVSSHWPFDLIDNAYVFPSRHHVKIFKGATLGYMTYFREDGTELHPHTSIAISRTRDGKNWEVPYLVTAVIGAPAITLKRGNHVYLLNSSACYRSPSAGYMEDAQTTLDITDYLIDVGISQGDAQKVNLTLANPQQVLDALAPFSTDGSLQVRVKLGYTVAGTDLEIQTLLADVDAIGGTAAGPQDHEIISARDFLGRMLTMTADQAVERFNQVVGADNFAGTSDYEGMRHTAPLEGNWKTEGGVNILSLVTNMAEGIATTTYAFDSWNGVIQAGIKVTPEGGGGA